MKIMFISDIHGMSGTLKKALSFADQWQCDRLVILGDILYHGPRNGVPDRYNPTEVVELLNARKDQLLSVRGNCDAEVDQMLLNFPIMAEYSELLCGKIRFFLTHGHLWNENHLPELGANSILAHGHTHIAEIKHIAERGITIFNPGSISLPKNTSVKSFGWLENNTLSIRDLENGSIIKEVEII